MSGMKDIFKKGWHPEKDGTTFKGHMKGLIGRGDTNEEIRHTNHQARPLSSLKDPSSFGPPPKHVGAGGSITGGNPLAPPPYSPAPTSAKPAPPRLPPRLPPRSGAASPAPAPPPPPPARTPTPETSRSDGLWNQGAVNRLGAAGLSVPGLGIGTSAPASQRSSAQPSEFESRFAKLGLSSSSVAASGSSNAPSEGTTLAQKQASLKTAAAFHKDPTSVSFADVRTAASTANNFRQRHGDQVAAGLRTANTLNEKYGIAGRVAAVTGRGTADGVLATKKPPPPPPPKENPGLASHAQAHVDDEPPPIPMATRPRF